MTPAAQPTAWESSRISFKLDRFELDGGRVELTGRWFGVRGRRFIRPTLTLLADGEPYRALADLEHKPWAAEDGEQWSAAFPVAGELEGIEEAELSVAPDITVALAVPGARRRNGRRRAPAARTRAADHGPARRELETLTRQLAEARKEIERLRRDLEATTAAQEELAAEHDALSAELRQAVSARDKAVAARDRALEERQQAIYERDQATRARDGALTVRDHAVAERDAAVRARDEALHARNTVVRERDAAVHARDGVARERDAAVAMRNDALSKHAEILAERDELAAASRRLELERRELELERREAASSRGAAMVMRNATIDASISRRDSAWAQRALAVMVLIGVLIALAVVVRAF